MLQPQIKLNKSNEKILITFFTWETKVLIVRLIYRFEGTKRKMLVFITEAFFEKYPFFTSFLPVTSLRNNFWTTNNRRS